MGDTWHGACVKVTLGLISGVMVKHGRRSREDKVEWEERRIGCSCWNWWGKRETKRRKERKRKKERKRERGREGGRTVRSFLDLRRSNDRSPSGQELKFIYSTRATLQEVGIIPTWVYFHPKGMFGRIFVDDEAALF